MPNSDKHSIQSVLHRASEQIALIDAEVLLSHILRKPREYFLSHPEILVSFWQRYQLQHAITKRKRDLPLAYLTGHKEFYGLDFAVNKHTLIPRPETELMVDCVIEELRSTKYESRMVTMIDVGTGSGCIPISIMKTQEHKNIKTIAIDISRGALRIARKNAKTHSTNITFLHGNLLEPIRKLKIENCKLIITANLPYLTQEQFSSEPSIQHEPHSALVAEEYGLALYRKLLEQVRLYLPRPELGTKVGTCILFLEIDPSQSSSIQTLIKKILPQSTIEIKKDLRVQDRIVKITLRT